MAFEKGYTPWNKKEIPKVIIKCECGCGLDMEKFDNRGRAKKYLFGHGNRGRKFPNLKHDKQFKKGNIPHNKNIVGYKNKGSYKKGHEGMRGDNNPLWKGGVSFIHQGLRRTPIYAKWRLKVFERDEYTCQICGQKGGKLIADHYPYPFYKYPEHRLDINNGRTLCKDCNYKVTYITKEWQVIDD